MRRLRILVAASVLALGALPSPVWAELFVSSLNSGTVLRYSDGTGAFIDAFVTAGSGGLTGPFGLVFGPDGHLYVASAATAQVLRYNGTTGAFVDTFVTAGSGGLSSPLGLVFGPDGNLYVASHDTDQVLRYNGTTGAFISAFVTAASGGLSGPTFLVFRSSTSAPIPTVSEWGMILLALSLLTVGTWELTGRPALFGVATTSAGALLLMPSRPLVRSVLVGQMLAGMGLMLYGWGIERMAAHDVLGAILAGLLLGAMIECYRRGQGR